MDKQPSIGKLTYKYPNGDAYNGQTINNKPNGQGTMIYSNNDLYEGEWREGLKHGKGTLKISLGEDKQTASKGTYPGSVFMNPMFGKHASASSASSASSRSSYKMGSSSKPQVKYGDIYEGYWENDIMRGNGIIRYKDGNFYEGILENGMPNGDGIMKYKDGSSYNGKWMNKMRHGYGRMEFNNGNIYMGEWQKGYLNGQGTMSFINGDKYIGNWVNGKQKGHGIMKYLNGDVYIGEWEENNTNGYGTMEYANGDVYKGDWKYGIKDGKGTMIYVNGITFIGEWKNDKVYHHYNASVRHSKYRIKRMNKFDELTKWMSLCSVRELTIDEYNELHNIILTIDPTFKPITKKNIREACIILSIDYELSKLASEEDIEDIEDIKDKKHIKSLLSKLNSMISVPKKISDYMIKNSEQCHNDTDISGNNIKSQNVLKLGEYCYSYIDMVNGGWNQLDKITNPYTNELFSEYDVDLIKSYMLTLEDHVDIHKLGIIMPKDIEEFKYMMDVINNMYPNENTDDFFNLTYDQINKLIKNINYLHDIDIKLVHEPKDHMDIFLQLKHNIEERNSLEFFMPSIFLYLEHEPYKTFVLENNEREKQILKNNIELNSINLLLKKNESLNISKNVYKDKYYSTMPEIENLLLKVKYLIFKYRWMTRDNIMYKFKKFIEDVHEGKYDNRHGLYNLFRIISGIYLHLLDNDDNDDSFPDIIRNINGYFDIFIKSSKFAKYLLESNSILCINAKFEFIANKLTDREQNKEKYVKSQIKFTNYLTNTIEKLCKSDNKLTVNNIYNLITLDEKLTKSFNDMITLHNTINKENISYDNMMKYLIEEVINFTDCISL